MQTTTPYTRTRVGEYLREQGLINQQKLDVALQEQAITGESGRNPDPVRFF